MWKLVVIALVGLAAQLVDGSLGMAYGVTSSSLLLAVGMAPAAASAAVHFAEIGTTLVSGVSHTKLGNVDWRTVGIMAVPGGIAAFLGATLLASLDGDLVKPFVAVLLLLLGAYVLVRFLVLRGGRPTIKGSPKAVFLIPLGAVAGFMDSVGGGGWGPVGTTTLLSSGRLEPRKVVGSIDTAEFVVAIGGSVGFLLALGHAGIPWSVAGALLLGGVVAAPIAAYLVRIMPAMVLGVAAGGLIIVTNVRTLGKAVGIDGAILSPVLITLGAAAIALTIWSILAVRRRSLTERAEAPAESGNSDAELLDRKL
ncbi:sulfite exporter TauE/SafE family protein [Granulicoccus sp. GXG6511]|uniref:sulfite exporter TauE/SafE family protein n=1 Tax=Granulicoccus sp. GXG6511 TaxID=3381351 RepID=UPI003D7E5EBE